MRETFKKHYEALREKLSTFLPENWHKHPFFLGSILIVLGFIVLPLLLRNVEHDSLSIGGKIVNLPGKYDTKPRTISEEDLPASFTMGTGQRNFENTVSEIISILSHAEPVEIAADSTDLLLQDPLLGIPDEYWPQLAESTSPGCDCFLSKHAWDEARHSHAEALRRWQELSAQKTLLQDYRQAESDHNAHIITLAKHALQISQEKLNTALTSHLRQETLTPYFECSATCSLEKEMVGSGSLLTALNGLSAERKDSSNSLVFLIRSRLRTEQKLQEQLHAYLDSQYRFWASAKILEQEQLTSRYLKQLQTIAQLEQALQKSQMESIKILSTLASIESRN